MLPTGKAAFARPFHLSVRAPTLEATGFLNWLMRCELKMLAINERNDVLRNDD